MAQAPGDQRRSASVATGGIQAQRVGPGGAAPLGGVWSNLGTLSPLGSRLDLLRQTPPQLRQTVTRDGRTYKAFDNGRAITLVPTLEPGKSPHVQAEQRRAIERALFMAANPLAGAAYGAAAMAGASPHTRDLALAFGGAADAVIASSVPRTSRVQRATPTKQGQLAAPGWQRPNIRPSELNAKRQAGRVEATAIASMIGTGSGTKRSIRPPGFEGKAKVHARGHLFPKELGGSGRDPRNLVTLSQTPTNDSDMRGFDATVAQKVRQGEVVEYSSTPLYTQGILAPSLIVMTAAGSRGTSMAKVVRNPAGQPK